MPLLLVVLLVLVPLAEIWFLIEVGQAIGIVPTLLLLVADALIGGWLLKREGRKAWNAFRLALAQGRVPAREVADGALVMVGGAFLLSPGFLTDVIGLACVLPPTRAFLRGGLARVVGARLIR